MDSQGRTENVGPSTGAEGATTSTQADSSGNTTQQRQEDKRADPRFIIELEFVSSLGNPYYISHLAATYPYLFGASSDASEGASDDENAVEGPESRAFAAYLEYLYAYWRRPEYTQFLPYPVSSLRSLRLLQEPSFRHNVIKPQVIEALVGLDIQPEPAPEVGAESQHEG